MTTISVVWLQPLLDFVFDLMDCLALCMFRKYIEYVKKSLEFDLQSRSKCIQAMAEVATNKPRNLEGHWPKHLFSRLGFFKAEYTRFVLFCLPHILYVLDWDDSTPMGALGILVTDIARLFYLKTRQVGWRSETLYTA